MGWNPITFTNNALNMQQEFKAEMPGFVAQKNAELGLNKLPGVGRLTGPTASSASADPQANQAMGVAKSESSFRADLQHKYQIHVASVTSNVENPVVSVTGFLPEDISVDISSDYTPAFGEGLFDPNAGLVQKAVRLSGFSGISQEMSVKIWESTQGINLSVPITFIAGEIIGGRPINNIIDPVMDLMSLCTPSKNKGDWFLTPPGPKVVADFAALGKVLKDTAALSASVALEGASAMPGTGTAVDAGRAIANKSIDVVSKTTGVDLSTFSLEGVNKQVNDLQSSWNQMDFKNILRFDSKISIYIGDFLYFDNVVVNSVSQNYSMILDEMGNPMRVTVTLNFTTMLSPTIQDLRKIFLHNTRRDLNK